MSKADSSRDFFFFFFASVFLLEIIYVVVPNTKTSLCILAPAAEATAVNGNGMKTSLGNGWGIFFTKSKPDFSNGPRNLPRNPLDCNILDS